MPSNDADPAVDNQTKWQDFPIAAVKSAWLAGYPPCLKKTEACAPVFLLCDVSSFIP